MTLHPSPLDSRDYRCLSSTANLPTKVDLRRFISSTEQQSYTSSCAAHAGTTICEMLEAVNGVSQGDLSRLDLYHSARILSGLRDKDAGVYLRDICKALTDTGVAQETDWPFNPAKVMETPPATLSRKRCTKYSAIDRNDWATVKSMLSRGYPILMGAMIYEGFHSIRGNLDSHPSQFAAYTNTSKSYGGHAMVTVGFDDAKRYWIIANSWGADWGDDGCFALPYGLLERDCFELWAIEEFNGLKMDDVLSAGDAFNLNTENNAELVVWRNLPLDNKLVKRMSVSCKGGRLPYRYAVENLPPWLTLLEQSGGNFTFMFTYSANETLDGKFTLTAMDALGQSDSAEIHAVGFPSYRQFDATRAAEIKGFLSKQFAEWKVAAREYGCIPGEVDAAMGWSEGTFDRMTNV